MIKNTDRERLTPLFPGEKNKGWQYGENLRTQRCGWFPVAYTELLHEEDDSALG